MERTKGSRQDIAFEGAAPVYPNRVLRVELLDEQLRVPGAENIWHENLFIYLTSVELVAFVRVHAIVYLAHGQVRLAKPPDYSRSEANAIQAKERARGKGEDSATKKREPETAREDDAVQKDKIKRVT
eukprot:4654785-Pleurochrysis_carterae.AAC.1